MQASSTMSIDGVQETPPATLQAPEIAEPPEVQTTNMHAIVSIYTSH